MNSPMYELAASDVKFQVVVTKQSRGYRETVSHLFSKTNRAGFIDPYDKRNRIDTLFLIEPHFTLFMNTITNELAV